MIEVAPVKVEIERLVGRNAQSQRVGAERAGNAEGRRNGRTRVGAGDADAALLGRHRGVVARDAVVAGIANDDHAHAVLLRLVDCQLHGLVADDLTHTVVAVHNRGGLGFLDDFKIGYGVLDASLDAVQVNGLEAVDAVGLDAAMIGLEQHVRANLRILFRNAVLNERFGNEIGNGLPIDDDSACHDDFLLYIRT